MTDKECFKCKRELPISSFYKHKRMADGYLNKCKDCARSDVKANRESNSEYYKEYDRDRANDPHRVEARKAYAKTAAGIVANKRANAAYVKRHPDRILEKTRKYRRTHKKVAVAHGIVGYAIKCGHLVKAVCEQCGSDKTHGHHDDYAEPLNVRWLCAACHKQWHTKNGEGKNA